MEEYTTISTDKFGRIEDIRIATDILRGKKIPEGFQLLVIPASLEIYKQAMQEGLVIDLINAGANFLTPSCGPCLGTGQGIPADNYNVISTANRNFLGRMGNEKANIYLASPATVAYSALKGEITDPRGITANDVFPYAKESAGGEGHKITEDRYSETVWNYSDIDNLNTDQMFAGNLTYNVNSSEADKIMPHLFKGIDESFAEKVKADDILVTGWNFGCGSSREHPSVGLAYAGIKAVIVKSVNRIFYRSSVNQGLPILVVPEAVDNYKQGDKVEIDFANGKIIIAAKDYAFAPLPEKLMKIFEAKGLVNYIKNNK
jgi:3-isopropylmalate dehydratase small subunit